ncbi:MAG: gliding motility-associated C-terminal domain-containing protein [Saprospiraceae bacterium]|nr:gliding motility-associated C-terminal domain-containing protein [Candidatus Opimibacter iunctus]
MSKRRSYHKVYAILYYTFTFLTLSTAQNLVPNPDFEMYDNCPSNIGSGYLHCLPWEDGNNGTSDYFNACDITGFVDVPSNNFGNQLAHSGDGYAGFFVRSQTTDYFEYIQAPLIQPLEGGVTYHVSFYISLADEFCGSKHIGAYFSFQPPPFTGSDRLDVVPQIDYVIDTFLSDNSGWMLISGCFTAEGDEAYITIGNFHLATETVLDPDCSPAFIYSYYYIDDVVVEEGPDPGVIPLDLGGPVSVCDSFVIQPGVDYVGYHWEDGSVADSLLVMTTGNYAVTISDGCNVGLDSIDITIQGSPAPVSIGIDSVTICNGDHFDISLDPIWDYQWSNGDMTSDVSLTSSGTYFVTRDDGCNLTTDSIVMNVANPPAPFSLGMDAAICVGSSITIELDSTWGAFVWQDGSTASMYHVTMDGLYAVTVSNGCGSASDDIMISSIQLPSVELGGPQINLCAGNTLLIDLDTLDAAFIWQDGSTDSSYLVSTEGFYSVTVSNQCGSDSDTLLVDQILMPTVDLGADLDLCFAQLPYQLDVTGSPEATDYLWQDGTTIPVFVVASPGDYSVTVSNACFSAADTIHVQVNNGFPQVVLPADVTICEGDTLVLFNTGTSGAYTWNDMSTDTSLVVTSGGSYSLTVTNVCGSGADTIHVGMIALPPLPDLGADDILCPGDTLQLSPMISGFSFLWQDMSTADSFLVVSPGTYFVQATNLCGNSADTMVVSAGGLVPPFDLGPDTMICQGSTLVLGVNIPDADFTWQDGSSLSSFTVVSPGDYYVEASNSCSLESDTISINFLEPPLPFDLGPDTTICPGEFILLEAPSTAFEITWQDGSNQSVFLADEAMTYQLRLQNECGVEEDSLTVEIDTLQPILDLEPEIPWCMGDTIVLDATQAFDATYTWSTGEQTPVILVTHPGLYVASVAVPCTSISDEVEVLQSAECIESKFYLPNVFSPNTDGVNDVFQLAVSEGIVILSNEVSVFDRWGNLLYYSTDVPFAWDGFASSDDTPSAVYVYIIHLQYAINGVHEEAILTGDVTLLR